MVDEKKFSTHDLEIAEKLGGISALQETILNRLDEYMTDNKTQHKALWVRIDGHSRKINWMMGCAATVSACATYAALWLKHKFWSSGG